MEFWKKSNVPTTQFPNVVSKLKRLHAEHASVSKNKHRYSEKQRQLETAFTASLAILFNIAHSECAQLIRVPQDLEFLVDQRSCRKMAMGDEDEGFKTQEEKRRKRVHDELSRQRVEEMRQTSFSAHCPIFQSGDAFENEGPSSSSDEAFDAISSYHRKRIMRVSTGSEPTSCEFEPVFRPTSDKRCVIGDPLFNASLDRTNTTSRQAMHIIALALSAAGVDLTSITLSTSSLHEARKNSRKAIGASIKETFCPTVPLIAHFDGKMLPDCEGGKSDRMAVVVSGKDVEKLLGIPRLPNVSGAHMGQKVVDILQEWTDVVPHLAGLSSDTIASNTGIHRGAITVIQEAFNRRLFYIACRHHILEIVAAAVFDILRVLQSRDHTFWKI